MDYWLYPWPVEIVNESSASAWLAPILALIGSALLFGGGLYGVHKTNEAAGLRQHQELTAARARHNAEMGATQKHHEEQLAALRAEGRAERAAQRNDRFRQEVADLLGESWAAEKAAYELATNAEEYYNGLRDRTVESAQIAELLRIRNEYTPQLNKVEHLAIRASLLTNDPQASEVLDEIRTAAQGWKNLVDDGNHYGTFIDIRDRLEAAFKKLETLTRQLVTSDGAA